MNLRAFLDWAVWTLRVAELLVCKEIERKIEEKVF
jgi:hypothetical protein